MAADRLLAGFGFALYLTHIERDILTVWCLYCVISQGIIALILLMSLAWLAWQRRSKPKAQQEA